MRAQNKSGLKSPRPAGFGRLFFFAACLGAASLASAADKAYCVKVDYSAVPALVNYRKITLIVNVGTCASVAVTADGAAVSAVYNSSSGTAVFTTTGSSIVVTAQNWTAGGTGAATKATLYNNYHWAYSLTFDDNRLTQYENAKPLLDALGWRAGCAVVGSWANGGGAPGSGNYYMSWATLQALRAAGWDMFNHSYNHPNPLTCNNSATDIGTELSQNQTLLQQYFPGYNCNQMVYPYENSTASTCGGFPPSFLLSSECGGGSYNYVDTALPFQAQRGGLFGTDDTAWKSLAASAAGNSRPTWLVEYTHSVAAGSGAIADQYSTNAATLGDLLTYLNTNYGASGNKGMWFAPAGEVRDYLFTRDNAVVSTCTAATPTPSNTPAATATSTRTATPTPTATATFTRSATPSATASNTPTSSWTPTWTASSTASRTPTASATSTASFTPSATATPSMTPSATATRTPTSSSTPTWTAPFTASPTPTLTFTPTPSSTPSLTPTATGTATPTSSPTGTASMTPTPTDSMTPTASPTASLTPSPTSTASLSPTATSTATPTRTATSSSTPTASPSETGTASPTKTGTSTATSTFTPTRTSTPTAVFTSSPTSTFTLSATATATSTLTATSSATPTATATSTLTPTSTPTAVFTPSPTSSPTPTPVSTVGVVIFPNPSTGPGPVTVQLVLPSPAAQVEVMVFTPSFRKVNEAVLGNVPEGTSDVALPLADRWGKPLANGLYYVVLRAPQGRFIAKMLVLR